MYSNSAFYANGYIPGPPPYGSATLSGFEGSPPLYSSTSRYSTSSYTYSPRRSTSSFTYPSSHAWQTSSHHWGPGYRLSGGGRQVQYHQQQPQQRDKRQQNSVQHEYRIHMPQWPPNVQSFSQIPRNFGQIFRRSRQEFMASEDPSHGQGTGDHDDGGMNSSPRHVPRSAGYANISTAERNRRARAYNRHSRGKLMPILIDYGGQKKHEFFPDDWHQFIYLPVEQVVDLCEFYGIRTEDRSLHECRIVFLRFIGAKYLAKQLDNPEEYPDGQSMMYYSNDYAFGG